MQPVTNNPLAAPQLAPLPSVRPTATHPAKVEPAASTSSAQNLQQAAKRVETFVQPISSDLQFSVDETSGSTVVRVVDRSTQELIRQIPSEEMLAIAQALDRLQGLLLKQKA